MAEPLTPIDFFEKKRREGEDELNAYLKSIFEPVFGNAWESLRYDPRLRLSYRRVLSAPDAECFEMAMHLLSKDVVFYSDSSKGRLETTSVDKAGSNPPEIAS